MKNFVQPGDTIAVITPAGGYVSGRGYVFGKLFGVATLTTAEGEINQLVTRGVFEFPSTDPVAVEGDSAYYVISLGIVFNAPPYSDDTYDIGVIVGRTSAGFQVRLNGVAVVPA